MSARLISLAINIAVMGFILLEGVLSYLKRALADTVDTRQLRLLAESVAVGDGASLNQGGPGLAVIDPHGAIVHAALVHGFGLVMLYGGVGACVMAALSYATFGRDTLMRAAATVVD